MLNAIIFLRHGQTLFNRQGLVTGWRDPGLTPEGRQQALRAAQAVQGFGATELIVSPLRRCRETAAPLDVLTLPNKLEPDFRERGWGSLEGRSRNLRVDSLHGDDADAESLEMFRTRVENGLARLTGRPLVVSHSGVFRMLSIHLGVENGHPISNGEFRVLWRKACGRWSVGHGPI